jgi:hypothetical protein
MANAKLPDDRGESISSRRIVTGPPRTGGTMTMAHEAALVIAAINTRPDSRGFLLASFQDAERPDRDGKRLEPHQTGIHADRRVRAQAADGSQSLCVSDVGPNGPRGFRTLPSGTRTRHALGGEPGSLTRSGAVRQVTAPPDPSR